MAHHARSAEPAEHHVGESSDTVVDVAAMGDMSADPCSYANVLALRQTGLHMELVVDFEKKTLAGTATLSLAVLDPACEVCTLDTRDLTIRKVVSAAAPDVPLTFEYGDTSEALGAQLKIFLPAPAGGSHKLLLSYETSPESMAIGWLPPEQTAGKAHPYMFTQCQAIHARGLVPCQDSPGVKCPYTATLSVPGELTALMSAVRSAEPKAADDDSGRTIFSFSQPVPTSSYLIAIACGNLTAIRVGPRTQVWSEPEMVEAGAFEFADTEQFVAIGEQICGPYEWGVYDILLLPPSFPYGGMENPCLTFVTPTLLAGDKSQATVIAHEVTHSWMGNLVSPENWNHFWLNEGWTRFVETKIMEAHGGKGVAHLKVNEGLKALSDSVKEFEHRNERHYTRLVQDLAGTDPDDAFSSIPYEKGMSFLWYLQDVIGGEGPMGDFIKVYVKTFRRQPLNSDKFKAFFLQYFSEKGSAEAKAALPKIDWETWFHGEGMPPVLPAPVMDKLKEAQELGQLWANGSWSTATDAELDIGNYHSEQVVVLLDTILIAKPQGLEHAVLDKMQSLYSLSSQKNSEIRFRWQLLGVTSRWQSIYPHTVDFLAAQGRMKFVRPLYRALFRGDAAAKELALATFTRLKPTYHNITAKMVGRDLELTS